VLPSFPWSSRSNLVLQNLLAGNLCSLFLQEDTGLGVKEGAILRAYQKIIWCDLKISCNRQLMRKLFMHVAGEMVSLQYLMNRTSRYLCI
jgi:hypothetical protein